MQHEQRSGRGTSAEAAALIEPVCGMSVDPARAAGSHDYRGHTYYFCSRSCLDRFRQDPDRALEKSTARPATSSLRASTLDAAPARSYICPMDPEVRESKPGACPKCGMALEPDPASPDSVVASGPVEYTCPMHPEIVRDGPGACPKCGMALEPRVAAVEDEPNPELIDMTRRL